MGRMVRAGRDGVGRPGGVTGGASRTGATALRVCALLLATALTTALAACGSSGDGDGQSAKASRPVGVEAGEGPAPLPVPQGKGVKGVKNVKNSAARPDFNGDGYPDLVINDLVKGPDDSHGDDAGIGIVYGSRTGLRPATRQLLNPARLAAPTKGQVPATFDAEAFCDLDGDGFTDLVVSTDPPYDGQGAPPVPLQILFGSPGGLTGKAVKVRIPDRARIGNDWPDQPVCGDFDGDGAMDLVVHASNSSLSFLRGPFSRTGAPRAAGAPLPAPGNVPAGPAVDVNGDGYDDLVVRTQSGASKSAVVFGGPDGPAETGVLLPSGLDVAFGRFGKGKGMDAAIGSQSGTALRYEIPGTARATLAVPGTVLDSGDFDGDGRDDLVSSGSRLRIFPGTASGLSTAGEVVVRPKATGTTRVLAVADFDGDKRADLVVRTARDETRDTVAVYPGATEGLIARAPKVTFSTAMFLGMK
ncbi:FG-GAP repeat domain-containing protein [Streptomyces sp. NPDC058001]|uniref:FG-GAP repeat domain-containing protein n=1 Tax=Streptomyces sp. NPDC058001 TaxID=3346300 RepID=UPI0036EF8E2A